MGAFSTRVRHLVASRNARVRPRVRPLARRARALRLSVTRRATNMATAQEVKLFGKWTFDDVEVRAMRARR